MKKNININIGGRFKVTFNLIFKNSYYCNLRKAEYCIYNIYFNNKLILEEFELFKGSIEENDLIASKLKQSKKIKSLLTREINKQFKLK